MKSTFRIYAALLAVSYSLVTFSGCSSGKHLNDVRNYNTFSKITLDDYAIRDTSQVKPVATLAPEHRPGRKVRDDSGHDLILMDAVLDRETGEMVATESIDAVVVTATFRNVAERGGKVNLNFNIKVPGSLHDSRWQLRFYPIMVINSDSTSLEPLYITGQDYRRTQLKGYQQYQRFLSRIIEDSTVFIDMEKLEIFLRRNIPQLYSYKTDSTEVSDTEFYSCFGVSEAQALDHYTDKIARSMNNRRRSSKSRMFRHYVKAPIQKEGIRLDTVMRTGAGDFDYHYCYTLKSRPGIRKVEMLLRGDIYEQDRLLFKIPQDGPITFYISSIASLAQMGDHFMTKVIERRVLKSVNSNLMFSVGSCRINPLLDSNSVELERISNHINEIEKGEEFLLDSIVVISSASPDGPLSLNNSLSTARGKAIAAYMNGKYKFKYRTCGENWEMLDRLVMADTLLGNYQKLSYRRIRQTVKNKDKCDETLKKESYYPYLKDNLYPRLRNVEFRMYMQRRGMIKDTVHTSIIDTVYMKGLKYLKDMEYEKALSVLGEYQDYNTAVTLLCLFENKAAYRILRKLPLSAQGEYLMAIASSRENMEKLSVQHFKRACELNSFYFHRGNLDPEISSLVNKYHLSDFPE